MSKKKELGKGLRALLNNIEQTNTTPSTTKEVVKELSSSTADIDITDIEVNPFQPRSEFDAQELKDLTQSIKIHGLIQPVTVRSLGGGKFQLISGERRLRACKLAGKTSVPAYVRIADDQEMLEMALVENIQRSNLNAMEVAISYQRLIDECSLTQDELSNRVGKERSTISNYVRLLKLPPNIQTGIKQAKISMGHARALAGIDNITLQLELYHQTLRNNLSVRKLEDLIRSYAKGELTKKSSKSEKQSIPAEVIQIKDRLSGKLGTRIDIKRNESGKGQIIIKFKNNREFNNLVDRLEELED